MMIQYLGRNFTKEGQNLRSETETLLQTMSERHSCVMWIGREVSTPWFPRVQWISIKILGF